MGSLLEGPDLLNFSFTKIPLTPVRFAHGTSLWLDFASPETEEGLKQKAPLRMLFSGPREIRTVRSLLKGLDLLNYPLMKEQPFGCS